VLHILSPYIVFELRSAKFSRPELPIILCCVCRFEHRREAVTNDFDIPAFELVNQHPVLGSTLIRFNYSFIPYFFFQSRSEEDI
jgi:hypothetical protein